MLLDLHIEISRMRKTVQIVTISAPKSIVLLRSDLGARLWTEELLPMASMVCKSKFPSPSIKRIWVFTRAVTK